MSREPGAGEHTDRAGDHQGGEEPRPGRVFAGDPPASLTEAIRFANDAFGQYGMRLDVR